MRKILFAALCGLIASVGLATPAQASGATFNVYRSAAITKYEGCHNYGFHYDVPDSVLEQAAGWSIDVTFYDPTGTESTADYVYDGADPSSGTVYAYICDYERAGTWSLDAQLDWYDYDYNDHYVSTSSSFVVKKCSTRTSLAVNDSTARYGQKLTFTAVAQRTFPNGWFGDSYAPIVLQKYVSGAWRTIAAKSADSSGKARFVVTWKHRKAVKVRAARQTTDGAYGSYSQVRTIY